MQLNWVITWIISGAAAAAAAPLIISLYQRLGWVDDPAKQKHPKVVHTYPVPRGGGLVVSTGIIAGVVLLNHYDPSLNGILLGALLLLISGTLDDAYNLSPYLRIVINILAAVCVVLSGIGIDYITNPLGAGVIFLNQWPISLLLFNHPLSFSLPADLLAIAWIVWNMNAVNWAKGVDGQLPGFVSLSAIFIALLALRFIGDTSQVTVINLALSVSGAYAGLLLWNKYPQKMMPGYAAGSLGGYFLSVLAILSGAKIATVLLLLAIPTADGIFTLVRRLAKGQSPVWGDRAHLHHRMLDAGWGKRRIAVFYWVTTALFGIIALQLDSRAKLYAMMAAAIVFTAMIIWFKRSITSSKPPVPDNG